MAGNIIRESTRAAGAATVADVMSMAAQRAEAAGASTLIEHARAPFTMLEHSPRTIEAFTKRFARATVWTDEGNCFNRAMLGAHLLDRDVRLGAGPADDVFAAAIAVSPHRHLDGGYNGGFHAALAVKVRGESELAIVDLLPGNPRRNTLSGWSVDPNPLVLRPFAGTGLFDGVSHRSTWVGPEYFEFARDQLTHTWNNAEAHGVRIMRAPMQEM